jgi:hypothetical protein
MFGFGFRKIRPFNNETIFAHVASQLALDYHSLKCELPEPWWARKSKFEVPFGFRGAVINRLTVSLTV